MERFSRMILVIFLFFSGGYSKDFEEWKCGSGEIINKDFKCDSMIDCRDGSDETKDLCAVSCPEETFSCHNMAKCIDTELLCDDFDDCGDNSDEAPEICRKPVTTTLIQSTASPCPPSEFSCRDGLRCLPMKYVCDDRPDCPDGSDEKFEMCCNSKLDIGNQTSPCDTNAPAASTRKPPPKKCLKKACIKKCKDFWDVLPLVLSGKTKKKLIRKCAKNPTSKRCTKCRPLLLQLGMKTETKPKKKKGRGGKGRKKYRKKARRNEIL